MRAPRQGTVVVLDGGLATELEAAGHDLADRLWSARLLLTEPEAIEAVHLAYYRAGAQVATTASYQATIPGFEAAGLDRATALAAIRRSVSLARRARDRFAAETGRSTDGLLVAGSVGPYGAMLADGSEYRGDYDPGRRAPGRAPPATDRGAARGRRRPAGVRDHPHGPRGRGPRRAAGRDRRHGLAQLRVPRRCATAAGEPIEEAVALGEEPGIVAVGVNCTPPRHLPALLARARRQRPAADRLSDRGDRWDPSARRWPADAAGSYDPATVAPGRGSAPSGWAAAAGRRRPTSRRWPPPSGPPRPLPEHSNTRTRLSAHPRVGGGDQTVSVDRREKIRIAARINASISVQAISATIAAMSRTEP